MKITILCPYHENTEDIELPSSYSNNFDGQIPCAGPKDDKSSLHLVLKGGQVHTIERVATQRPA